MWETMSWGGGCADGAGAKPEQELGQKTSLSNMGMEMEKRCLSLREGISDEECPGRRIMSSFRDIQYFDTCGAAR